MAAIPEIEGNIEKLKKTKATKDELSMFEEKVTFYYLLKEDHYKLIDEIQNTNFMNKQQFGKIDE